VEQVPLALVTGISLQILFANMLSMVLSPPLSFWLGAVLVLALGVAFSARGGWREIMRVPLLPGQIAALLGSFWLALMLQRGLAIFDDFAHLPTASIMATGDIPPHFPFDPAVLYAYHYFLLLFGAQIARIGDLPVWVSLDIARALAFAITVVLAGAWVQRLTLSLAAGILSGLMVVFGTGTRWLLLLLPGVVVRRLSSSVEMIGSGRGSGENLAAALTGSWAVEGVGHVSIPFAFANGIHPPGILAASGPNGIIFTGISIFFLQTFNRWRSWRGALVSALMLATFAMLTEAGVVLSVAGWGALALIYMVQRRALKLPRDLWQWLAVVAAGNILGALQGGALTDILVSGVRGLFGETAASYQTVGFALTLNPAIVSAHLGVLRLGFPAQLLVALAELGPLVLVLPLAAAWGIKAYRAGRWYEAAFILASFLSLGTLFVLFSGSTGVRNTTRLYSFTHLILIYAVPLAWIWCARRAPAVRAAVALLAFVAMFGGFVMLGILLPVTQRPDTSYFLTALDARISKQYWNQLEPGVLVFDPEPSRGTTVFGRAADAAYTWYAFKPEWQDLVASPDPFRLNQAGYRYAYFDNRYFDQLDPAHRQTFQDACVQLVEEVADRENNYRRLLDLSDCQ
jgi:hypothetical protein